MSSAFSMLTQQFQQKNHKRIPDIFINTIPAEINTLQYPKSTEPKISISTFHGVLTEQNPIMANTKIDVDYMFGVITTMCKKRTSDNNYIIGVHTEHLDDEHQSVQSPSSVHQGSLTYYIDQIQRKLEVYSYTNSTIVIVDKDGFPNGCNFKIKVKSMDESRDKSRTIDCKLFNALKLQLTGCKTLEEAMIVSSMIIDLIKCIFNRNFVFVPQKVSMIRANYNTNFKMDLNKLYSVLRNDYKNLNVMYNPADFRGIKIYWIAPFCEIINKKQQQVTFIVHSTGSVAIMCQNNYENVEKCWDFMNKIFEEIYDKIVV